MAVDIFLKLSNDIKGESKDKSHKDDIDVLAWSWGLSQSGTFHQGGGGGSGKANFQDISITKYVDTASSALMDACAKGTHLEKAELFVRKAGGTAPLEYIIITMEKCLISSISTGGSGGEDRLTENVSINFAKLKYSYVPQKDDGTGDVAKDFVFDIEANSAE